MVAGVVPKIVAVLRIEQVLLLQEVSQFGLGHTLALFVRAPSSSRARQCLREAPNCGCGAGDGVGRWIDSAPMPRLKALEDLILVLLHYVNWTHRAYWGQRPYSAKCLLAASEILEVDQTRSEMR